MGVSHARETDPRGSHSQSFARNRQGTWGWSASGKHGGPWVPATAVIGEH